MSETRHDAEAEFLAYFRDAGNAARRYPGQLRPEFQALAERAHAGVPAGECHFYHSIDLRDGETVTGAWDLRAGVRDYLGHLRLEGQSVLELGPATGQLGFHMESAGARVTAFEIAPFVVQELLPLPGHDLEVHRRNAVEFSRQVRNGWWYCRERLGSRTPAVYGDIYHLPEDLGRFDVSTFGSILLHLEQPFAALRQAAAVTDKAIVVTDLLERWIDLKSGFLEFNPGDMPDNLVNWWWVTPGAAMKMLSVLGFPVHRVFFHEQDFHPGHDMSRPPTKVALYTVVGQRAEGLVPYEAVGAEAEAVERRLLERMRMGLSYDELVARNRSLEAELGRVYASTSWRATRPFRALGDMFRPASGPGGRTP